MKLLALLSLLFVSFCRAETPPAAVVDTAITKGQSVVMCGHSFHIFTARQVAELAKQAGIAEHEIAAMQMLGGSRVIQHWELTGAAATARKTIEAGRVDALTLSPHLKMPDEGIDHFADLALKHNAAARVIVQASWIPWDGVERGFKKADYNATPLEKVAQLAEGHAALCRAQAKAINERTGKPIVFVSPAGTAVAKLRAQIRAGKVPGIAKDEEIFRDDMGHGRMVLEHLVSYVTFATLYRRDPSGLPGFRAERGEATSPELQRALQAIAWEAVTAEPMSGVKAAKVAQ